MHCFRVKKLRVTVKSKLRQHCY